MTILLIIVIDNIDKKDYHTHRQIKKKLYTSPKTKNNNNDNIFLR